ncbi:aromatic acid/H+ symport family MFS transporter [Pseudonocardia nematodicida]|uniref:Aromatic acid/H+ symport family MFS transporter n=1 Tax=Pseudonocardia nematodicida TaxID=1206997 RepID=A0ABV1KAX4_9PSEU
MSPHDAHAPATQHRAAGLLVLLACWAAVVADGYDVVVYGAVLPSLLQEQSWGLTPGLAGLLGSVPLIGMFFGSLVGGSLADRVGRRRLLILCVVWFSLLTAACALVADPLTFAVLRFLAGLGLGGVLPVASAITAEFLPARYRNLVYAVMFSGFPVGGVAAALIGISVIPTFGWRPMFALALVPGLIVVPLALRVVPESVGVLRRRGDHVEADAVARRFGLPPQPTAADPAAEPAGRPATALSLFTEGRAAATACFLVTSFLCLFMIYGVNTWLPQIMRQTGFSLGGALTFLLVFNLGAAVGTVLVALIADRVGSRGVLIGTFMLGALCILGMSLNPPLAPMYLLIGLTGIGTVGSQAFVLALVSKTYPIALAAPAMGWTLGVGRLGSVAAPLILGLLIGAGAAPGLSFLALAGAGVLAAVLTVLIPRQVGSAGTAPPRVPTPIRKGA